jgi:N-acyl-L-homoserine lactone synthetase
MWDALKFAIVGANRLSPENTPTMLNNVLGMLLGGKAQAWIMFEDVDGQRVLHGAVITCFMEDALFGIQYLLVHSVYGFKALPLEMIYEAMSCFEEFARANEATKVVGMTRDERLLKIYDRLGMVKEVYVYSKDV